MGVRVVVNKRNHTLYVLEAVRPHVAGAPPRPLLLGDKPLLLVPGDEGSHAVLADAVQNTTEVLCTFNVIKTRKFNNTN